MIHGQCDDTVTTRTYNMRRRTARRIAVCLAAAICYALAATVLPRQAWAQDGSLTIISQQQGEPTYNAYQVFCADVGADGLSSHIAWPSSELRDNVLAVLDGAGYEEWLSKNHPRLDQHGQAQNAAEFIGGCAELDGEPQARQQPSRSLLVSLARSLEDDEHVKAVTLIAGKETVMPQGHWIVLPAAGDVTDLANSAPLWVTVGGEPVTINEKADVPTLEKQVRDPSDHVWKKATTVHAGVPCSFRIVGTLPSTLHGFERFPYCVTDQLPKGSRIVLGNGKRLEDAVTVSIGGREVKPDGTHLAVSYEKHVLTVTFGNLVDAYWSEYAVSPGKNVVITYQAMLAQGSSSAQAGNVNSATLSYPNDPVHLDLTHTGETKACLLTHTLTLRKIDAKSGSPLAGARFSILRDQSGTKARKQLYVQADGSLKNKSHNFVTGKDGMVTIRGIGQGSYRIVEEATPQGYRGFTDPISLDITASVDAQTLHRTELSASTSSDVAAVESVDAKEGVIVLSIANEPDGQPSHETTVERLAQTGVGPLAASLAGTGLVIIALSLAVERRR